VSLEDIFGDIKKQQAERREHLGYSPAEFKKVQEKIEKDRREWTYHFDQYLEYIVAEEGLIVRPHEAVKKAADLADARAALLFERFPEELEIE
jgi:hypothetical protein